MRKALRIVTGIILILIAGFNVLYIPFWILMARAEPHCMKSGIIFLVTAIVLILTCLPCGNLLLKGIKTK